MGEWFILIYKIPVEPTRYRAGIWRKLKTAGAIYLQNGVAALPAGAGNERVLRGIVHEIAGMQGTAYLVRGVIAGDDAALLAVFQAARDAEYSEVLGRCGDFHAELAKERLAGNFTFAELEENEEDLAKLETWLGKIRSRDPFGAPRQADADQALEACRTDLAGFASAVYRAADHGSAAAVDGEQGETPDTPGGTTGGAG